MILELLLATAWTAAPRAPAAEKPDARTGIELVGRSDQDVPPYRWSLQGAKSKQKVVDARGRWGFAEAPAGEYVLALTPEGTSAQEVQWASVTIEEGKVTRVAIDSGIELAGRSGSDLPPQNWNVYKAEDAKRVARSYQRWGFTPLPPGEYYLTLVPQGVSADEVRWADVKVQADKVASFTIRTGIEVLGRSETDPPLQDWFVYRAEDAKRVARSYQHWGFTPLPPGEYYLTLIPQGVSADEVRWADVKVQADKVASFAIKTGIEVIGRSEKDPPLQDWFVYRAEDAKRVARSYQHWGFTPLPPGEYYLTLVPQGVSADEVRWADVKVEADKVASFAIMTGIEVVGRSEKDPPLQDWFVYRAEDAKRVARSYQHWGFTPLPPGEYYLTLVPQGVSADEVRWADVKVEADKVASFTIQTGIEVLGRSEKDPPLQDWFVYRAEDAKRVARSYQHWGFTPLPPGKYDLKLLPMGAAALEIGWSQVNVAEGKTLSVAVKSGIELRGKPETSEPPLDWFVNDPRTETRVARVNMSWGFTPLPAGTYTVEVPHQPKPFTTTVTVDADRVRSLTLTEQGFLGDQALPPPGAMPPGGLAVRLEPGDTVMALSWDPPPGMDVVGYRVVRSGATRPIHGASQLKEPRFLDIGLTNRREYKYRVTALLRDGSEWKGYREAAATLSAAPR